MNKIRKKPLLEAKVWWGVAVAVIVVGWLMTEPAVQDFWRGLGYQAEAKTQAVVDDLELTGKGERILKASRPVLEDSTEFNQHCENMGSDVSLLGCYAGGKIYVFEITADELVAANRVTMAHELLHAVWQRLGKNEQKKLTTELEELYQTQREWFDEELEAYAEENRIEEIYTRAGTKLENLTEELEKHYAKYFQNRAKIVAFYQEYEAPFVKLQAEMTELSAQIMKTNQLIEQARAEYLQAVGVLEQEIADFNNCAGQAGCFQTDREFGLRRNEILAREQELEDQRLALNEQIAENNQKIEQYRVRQESLGELSAALNSNIELMDEV